MKNSLRILVLLVLLSLFQTIPANARIIAPAQRTSFTNSTKAIQCTIAQGINLRVGINGFSMQIRNPSNCGVTVDVSGSVDCSNNGDTIEVPVDGAVRVPAGSTFSYRLNQVFPGAGAPTCQVVNWSNQPYSASVISVESPNQITNENSASSGSNSTASKPIKAPPIKFSTFTREQGSNIFTGKISYTSGSIAEISSASPKICLPSIDPSGVITVNALSSGLCLLKVSVPMSSQYLAQTASVSIPVTVLKTASCATTLNCRLGDVGPGGGRIVYIAKTRQVWGQYIEATMPLNTEFGFCNVNQGGGAFVFGTTWPMLPPDIGSGSQNTQQLKQCHGGILDLVDDFNLLDSPATSRHLTATDWILPSRDDLLAIYHYKQSHSQDTYFALTSKIDPSIFWSSSSGDNEAWTVNLTTGEPETYTFASNDGGGSNVMLVRYF